MKIGCARSNRWGTFRKCSVSPFLYFFSLSPRQILVFPAEPTARQRARPVSHSLPPPRLHSPLTPASWPFPSRASPQILPNPASPRDRLAVVAIVQNLSTHRTSEYENPGADLSTVPSFPPARSAVPD